MCSGLVTGRGKRSQGPDVWLGQAAAVTTCQACIASERKVRCAVGDEVGLKVERVVDRSVHRQETLAEPGMIREWRRVSQF
jgi:hypothetical protein